MIFVEKQRRFRPGRKNWSTAMNDDYSNLTDQRKAARRARERKRRKRERRRALIWRILPPLLILGGTAVVGLTVFMTQRTLSATASRSSAAGSDNGAYVSAPAATEAKIPASPLETANTVQLGDEIDSDYAILIDLDRNTVLAEKLPDTVISPASMTKIMTVLVAAENLPGNLDAPVTITADVTDFCFQNGCSAVGFSIGETVTVRDLFYGTILPSGGDAAVALAKYTAGSVDAFVALMNDKLDELGLSKTAHFTNCIGIYDKDHHCTVRDMAAILRAAAENSICREALSSHVYITSKTKEHPDGITLSNWFLRRIEDKDSGGLKVLYAKTGFVTESGNCAASYASGNGRNLICVTGMACSSWRCIYDHVALYKRFSKASGAA